MQTHRLTHSHEDENGKAKDTQDQHGQSRAALRHTPIPKYVSNRSNRVSGLSCVDTPGQTNAINSCVAGERDWTKAINEQDLEKRAFMVRILIRILRERDAADLQAKERSGSTSKVFAAQPSRFDGKDKNLKFKTWAQSALHFLKVKGQDENTFVLSAASWLQGPAQQQTQGLFNQKPAKDWGFQEWVQAMQDALFQIDPVLESRMWLHEVRLTDAKDFPKFAMISRITWL